MNTYNERKIPIDLYLILSKGQGQNFDLKAEIYSEKFKGCITQDCNCIWICAYI